MKVKNVSIRVKYIISYTVAFFIPFFVLSSLMYYSFTKILQNEINRNTTEIIINTRDSIDSRIEELNNISLHTSQNLYTRLISIPNDYSQSLKVIKALNDLTYTNSFYSTMLIYNDNNDLVYSHVGSFRITDYFNVINDFEIWDSNAFIYDIQNIKQNTTRPSETIRGLEISENYTGKYITYITPIPYGDKNPTGAIIYFISEQNIGRALENSIKSKEISVVVLDDNFVPIVSYGQDHHLNIENIYDIVNKGEFEIINKRINNSNYYIINVNSEVTGWTYIATIPSHYVYEKVIPLLWVLIIGFIIVVIIGLITVYLLSKKNYKPIGDIINLANKIFDKEIATNKKSIESKYLRNEFEEVTDVLNKLQYKIDDSKNYIRKSFLLKLIRGQFNNREEFDAENEFDVSLPYGLYNVVLIYINRINEMDIKKTIKEIETYNTANIKVYGVEGMAEKIIAIIIGIDENHLTKFDDFISNLSYQLKTKREINITVGIGRTVNELSELGSSYVQASSALDYRFVKGDFSIIYYDEIESHLLDEIYNPATKIESLKLTIVKANKQEALDILNDIFEEMKDKMILELSIMV